MPGTDIPDDDARQSYFRAVLSGGRRPPEDAPPAALTTPAPADEFLRKQRMRREDPVWTDRLPHGMATLAVSRIRDPVGEPSFRFQLRSCCADSDDFDDENFGRANLDVTTNVAMGGPPAAEYLRKIRVWSAGQDDLTAWVNDRRRDHGDDLELVIWDGTDLRIPWELLRLPGNAVARTPEGYLGALATVSRWPGRGLVDKERASSVTAPVPHRADGPVFGYLAPGMEADGELLRSSFAPKELREAESMWGLFESMRDEPGPFALVYVACHGEFSTAPDECNLDGFSVELATAFFNGELRGLTAQSTLVFLNSCYSGSSGIDTDQYNDGGLRGFAAVFVRGGAAGVLAATGAVGKDDARELAGHLFEMLQENPGLSVPQAVRRLRAERASVLEAIEREIGKNDAERARRRITMSEDERLVWDARAEDDAVTDTRRLVPFLYPFMYVYFGMPRMRATPAREGGQAETGETTGNGG